MEAINISSYPAYLLGQLKRLQNEAAMCDVRLRGDDGEVPAHSLVLMAASPYFENKLLKQESGEAEVIAFENVSVNILEAVVHFMYSGELAAEGDAIDKVIELCEELKLTQAVEAYKQTLVKGNEEAQQEKTSSHNEEVVENVTAVLVKNETLNNAIEYKPVIGKRFRQNLEVSKPVTDEIPVKKRRIARSSVSPDNKQDKVNKKSGGGKRKQLRPRKSVKSAITENTAGEGSGKLKTKIRIGNNARNIKVKKSDCDDGKPIENDSSVSEVPFVNTDNIKTEIDDDFGGDTDTETNIKLDQTPTVDDKDGSGAKVVKRRRRKVGDPEFPGKKKRRRKKFPCNLCKRILTSQKRLVFHQFSKHGSPIDEVNYNMYPCKEEGCDHISASRNNLETHMKSRHSVDRPHICEFCGKAFKLPNVLATHLNIHTGSKVWKCETCGESFNQQSGLQVHVKRHHMGESSWGELCHLCSEKFLQKSELAWHLFRAHDQPLPDRYKAYICYICNYLTKSSQDLKRHQNAHEGIKQFTCEICQKGCSTKSELKRHSSFHGEKSFKCTFDGCSFACTDSIGLGKHIKLMHTHKHYKPFICPVCPYRTGVKGNLDKHIRAVHNLVVVTKHTIQLKMKYSSFESGDIITKDGRLIASSKERKALQDQYRAENPDGIDRGLEYNQELGAHKLTSMVTTSENSSQTRPSSDKQIEDYIPRVDPISPAQSSQAEGSEVKNNFIHSLDDSSELRVLTSLSNYVYMEGSPPIAAVGMSMNAEDLRVSLGSQVGTTAAAVYRAASNGQYAEPKLQY